MELEEVIRTRRSIRKFQDREVPTELLTRAIELAVWAPSANNLQAWKLFVVKDRATKEAMANAVQAKANQIAGWPEAEEFGEAVESWRRGAVRFRGAPAVIAVAIASPETLVDKIQAKRVATDAEAQKIAEDRADANSRAQTAASLIAHLLLALHNFGLGAVWTVGPMMARRDLERVIGVPAGMRLFALLPVGYPAESPQPKPRKPVEEVLQIV